jgi:hypothetical protein
MEKIWSTRKLFWLFWYLPFPRIEEFNRENKLLRSFGRKTKTMFSELLWTPSNFHSTFYEEDNLLTYLLNVRHSLTSFEKRNKWVHVIFMEKVQILLIAYCIFKSNNLLYRGWHCKWSFFLRNLFFCLNLKCFSLLYFGQSRL